MNRSDRLKLLILEKDKKDIQIIKSLIKKINIHFQIKIANNKESYSNNVFTFLPDIIIANFFVNDITALDAIPVARKKDPNLIFILFTESVNEMTAVKCLKDGAWDYILKSKSEKLIPSINSALKFRNYELLNKHASEAIKKSEERYRSFIDQSTEGIYRIELNKPIDISIPENKQYTYLLKNSFVAECNNTMAKMHGFSKASEMVGIDLNNLMLIFGDKGKIYYKQFVKNSYKINNAEIHEIDKKGNSKFFLNNMTGIIDDGKLVRVWGVQKDITEIKKVEEALRRSEERFKLLFNNLLLGIYQMTFDGKLILANPALVKMLGYDSMGELLLNKRTVRKFSDKKERNIFFKLFAERDFIIGNESKWIRKDGSTMIVRESTRVIRNDKMKIISLEGVIEDISEKKKFETALIESEERFSLMADTAPIMIWIAGLDKLFFYFNKSWLEFTGGSLIEELGNRWMGKIHPDDISEFIDTYTSSFELKKDFEIVYRLKRYDEEYRWILTRGIPRFLSDGMFTGFIGTAIDITDRKIAEDALKESEELYKGVVESLTEGLIITDINDIIIFANQRMTEMTGFAIDEMIGNYGYKMFFEPDNWEIILNKNKNRFANISDRYEIEINKKNGDKFWARINGSPYRDSNGKIIGTIGAISDISKNKLAEKLIKESEEKYRSVVQNVREVIFKTDDTGIFTLLNQYWIEVTGYDIDGCLGKPLFDFIHPDDKKKSIDEFISIIYRKKDFCRFEVRAKTRSGSYRWMEINARIILDEDSNILGTYGTLGDIHERRLAEEELIKAKDKAEASDRLKSIFLAQISHEIRTPLNIILGYNSLVRERLKKEFGQEMESEFSIIETSGKRLLRTIDLILNMSLVQTGSYELVKEKIDLEKLFENLINEFKQIVENKKIKLIFKNTCKKSYIFGDVYTLSQAFQNLLDNAVKFTIEGQVEVILYEENENILIDITDTGVGISKDYLPRLFEPFTQEEEGYSRRFEGNGLGLALTKKYIELNGAEISVKSSKGKGTTFTVKIINKNLMEAQ